jgi:peptidoglycan hydrolase CwlO-like protein
MFSFDTAQIVAISGVAGAALTKLLDLFLARKKTDLDAVNARLAAVNDANSQLTSSLFQHIDRLEKEVAEMRRVIAHCEENHVKAQQEMAALRSEIASLRSTIRLN